MRVLGLNCSMNSSHQMPDGCLNCHLRSDDFFCALSQTSLEAFNRIKHAAVFPRGVVIFVEGQTPRGVFLLCQGQAKVSTTSRDGKAFSTCGSRNREKFSAWMRL